VNRVEHEFITSLLDLVHRKAAIDGGRHQQADAAGLPVTGRRRAEPEAHEQELNRTVSYMHPQVSPETRTAQGGIEVPNARNELRLGMYAEALVGDGGARRRR